MFLKQKIRARRLQPRSTNTTKEPSAVKPMWSDDTDALIAELAEHEISRRQLRSSKRNVGILDTYEHGGGEEKPCTACTGSRNTAETYGPSDDEESSIDEFVDSSMDEDEYRDASSYDSVIDPAYNHGEHSGPDAGQDYTQIDMVRAAKNRSKEMPLSLKDTPQCPIKKQEPVCLPENKDLAGVHDYDGRVRRVSFNKIEIREYPICLGDHPDCSTGPPLTIAWNPVREMHFSVNKFESMRESVRRHDSELKLSYLSRKCVLMELRYSDAELKRAMVDVRASKEFRAQSVKQGLIFVRFLGKIVTWDRCGRHILLNIGCITHQRKGSQKGRV